MKKHLIYLIVLCLLIPSTAIAAKKTKKSKFSDFSLGVMLGSPTGINAKYWHKSRKAIVAGLAFPSDKEINTHFHMDYIWHYPTKTKLKGKLPTYAGLGIRIISIDKKNESSNSDFGIRIPLGIEFLPNELPWDFFIELAPVVILAPEGKSAIDVAIGVRYRFPGK